MTPWEVAERLNSKCHWCDRIIYPTERFWHEPETRKKYHPECKEIIDALDDTTMRFIRTIAERPRSTRELDERTRRNARRLYKRCVCMGIPIRREKQGRDIVYYIDDDQNTKTNK